MAIDSSNNTSTEHCWHIKQFAELAGISVRALHYYDQINLLKPSHRNVKDYRLYTESDLLKLQQIIALKHFKLDLKTIRDIMKKKSSTFERLKKQSQLLKEQANMQLKAAAVLDEITTKYEKQEVIRWSQIAEAIHAYQSSDTSWITAFLTPEESKIYQQVPSTTVVTFVHQWNNLCHTIENNLQKKPTSEFACSLARQFMNCINQRFSNAYQLRNKIWHKGFKTGKAGSGLQLSTQGVQWIDKAIKAYYNKRTHTLLKRMSTRNHSMIWQQLLELMKERFADDTEETNKHLAALLHDPGITDTARFHLSQYIKTNTEKNEE